MKNIGNEEKLISMIDKNSYQLRKTIIKLSEFLKTLEILKTPQNLKSQVYSAFLR
jgi:hypothetical protein